ncbi:MAG TPA: outer membrane protein assembly factor BamC [Cycloclasticus sp.]|jgi:uncharacterized lipoprotein|nr:outer membrane protein assembly factor BamC [Cycloclasticus sp.]HIL93186.1 outer membrane protein assembly factor BamC [Cycloclasticus sp.]
MSIQTILLKLSCVAVVSLSLAACGSMPSMDGVFVDQKESYKRAHELPSLEMPPELSSGAIKDEYDGAVRTESFVTKKSVVKTTPLNEPTLAPAEIFTLGDVSYLLLHDNFRTSWRKTISALEELNYDIEDKNREKNIVYLNISDEVNDPGILSSLTFWKKSATSVYKLIFVEYSDSIAVKVQNDEGVFINNDVSKQIYNDLLSKLAQ